jgi:hypothetical protein
MCSSRRGSCGAGVLFACGSARADATWPSWVSTCRAARRPRRPSSRSPGRSSRRRRRCRARPASRRPAARSSRSQVAVAGFGTYCGSGGRRSIAFGRGRLPRRPGTGRAAGSGRRPRRRRGPSRRRCRRRPASPPRRARCCRRVPHRPVRPRVLAGPLDVHAGTADDQRVAGAGAGAPRDQRSCSSPQRCASSTEIQFAGSLQPAVVDDQQQLDAAPGSVVLRRVEDPVVRAPRVRDVVRPGRHLPRPVACATARWWAHSRAAATVTTATSYRIRVSAHGRMISGNGRCRHADTGPAVAQTIGVGPGECDGDGGLEDGRCDGRLERVDRGRELVGREPGRVAGGKMTTVVGGVVSCGVGERCGAVRGLELIDGAGAGAERCRTTPSRQVSSPSATATRTASAATANRHRHGGRTSTSGTSWSCGSTGGAGRVRVITAPTVAAAAHAPRR